MELGTSADFLESYELVAFDVADPEGSSNDVVAGAVHGGELLCVPNPGMSKSEGLHVQRLQTGKLQGR